MFASLSKEAWISIIAIIIDIVAIFIFWRLIINPPRVQGLSLGPWTIRGNEQSLCFSKHGSQPYCIS